MTRHPKDVKHILDCQLHVLASARNHTHKYATPIIRGACTIMKNVHAFLHVAGMAEAASCAIVTYW